MNQPTAHFHQRLPRLEVPDEERGHDEAGRLFRGREEVKVLARGEEPAGGVQVQQQVQRSQTPATMEDELEVTRFLESELLKLRNLRSFSRVDSKNRSSLILTDSKSILYIPESWS